MRSASQPRASLAIAVVFPTGEVFPELGIPGPAADATCARAGKLAAIINRIARVIVWTIRFQFTNPSS